MPFILSRAGRERRNFVLHRLPCSANGGPDHVLGNSFAILARRDPDLQAKERLTPGEVRRIALSAQGFADRRPQGPAGRRHVARVLSRIGLFQIDSVNVVTRAHTMPLYSRIGPYPAELLERAASR